jgi:hypothetical protein
MDLCKYKNIFGKPNEGVHSYRIFNLAIVDIIATLIAAFLISYFFKISFFYTCIFLFILGILFHKLFCVKTTIDKILFR